MIFHEQLTTSKKSPLKPSEDQETINSGAETREQDELYNFPFQPYDIQLKLMKVAYDTYENGKIALLESPTGTGKSLSLICSSLSWLRDNQNATKKKLEDEKSQLELKIEKLKEEENASGDWLSVQTKRQDVNRQLVEVNKKLDRIVKFEQRSEARRHAKRHNQPFEEYAILNPKQKNKITHEDDMLLKRRNIENESSNHILSSQSSQQSNDGAAQDEDAEIEKKIKDYQNDDELFVKPKIYYASRTHSQLSQFINEIKRTKFADNDNGENSSVKLTSLASRVNLCVNQEVLKLKDSNAINERCAELQRETKAEKRCPHLKGKQVNALKEDILSSVQDIEDIVTRGKILGACPYYATRMAIPEAEVVVLPYNNLLHHETREASSLDLRESIVIIDEAHNILETICSIHSAQISGMNLIGSHNILSRYYQKFYTRMSPKNAEMIRNIVQCLTALIKFLDEPQKYLREYDSPKVVDLNDSITAQSEEMSRTKISIVAESKPNLIPNRDELMVNVEKLIGAAKIERFNVFKIIDYFKRSQLGRKLIGFYRQDNSLDLMLELYGLDPNMEISVDNGMKVRSLKQMKPAKKIKLSNKKAIPDEKELAARKLGETNLTFLKEKNQEYQGKQSEAPILTTYPIYVLIEFLKSLTNLSNDGKVLIDHCKSSINQSLLKFILLNPSSQFKQMTQEARSIVLAGGTMQPFNEFIELLFSPLNISTQRLTLFSCGHVVNSNQLFVATLSNGATGKPLELSYKTRTSFETLDEIGRTIMNIASASPGGMVCFLPSYDYEQLCFTRWNKIGVIQKIETKSKQVFREPRQTNQVKVVLEEYSRVIEKGKNAKRGALLLCVVGGKLSEGINFNDDLGRCVVMVGLPYANIKSTELQQKMSYYDRTCKQSSAGGAGQQYYENLCLKGINQSIGRAIRHKEDYAAIVLLDSRYTTKNSIRNGLPQWLRESLVDYERFGPMFNQLSKFYQTVRSSTN